jgi:hypothetical protein
MSEASFSMQQLFAERQLAVYRDLIYILRGMRAAGMSLDLHPVRPEDEAFLFELYASTRADEMALVGWDKQQETMICSFQIQITIYRCCRGLPTMKVGFVFRGKPNVPGGR